MIESMRGAIGISLPRREVWEKVTGEAIFAADFCLPRCLEGKVLRSPYQHARIVHIDTSKARRLNGVHAVVTAQDLPDRLYGSGIADQPVLARERVRFIGERVAAVAAEDADTAMEAIEAIKMEYEELPVVADPVAAMAKGAPVLHPGRRGYRNSPVVAEIPGVEMGNVVDHLTYGVGNVEVGFAQADLVIEHTFHTQVVHQGYLEPHFAAVQIVNGQGVRVWTNNKAPHQLRSDLARLFGLPIEKIEVIYGFIGGDFGGKGAIMDEPACYYLAAASGRPVRIMMSVQEELMAANPRHATTLILKSGLRRDGTLVARQAKLIFDAGAYAGANSHPIVAGIRRSLGAYRIPNTRIDGYAVYTNSVPAGHCRAPGDPQAFFAEESHMDMLAKALNMDPYEFRRLNVLREGDISPSGLKWKHINALQVLEQAATLSNWHEARKKAGFRTVSHVVDTTATSTLTKDDENYPNYVINNQASRLVNRTSDLYYGIGMALTERATGLGGSAATVMLHADGSASVVSGATDPGTGSQTVLRQIAAEELQISLERVSFRGGNTGLTPYDNGSGSSRVTHVTGMAVVMAARDAMAQLKTMAAKQLAVGEESLHYRDGKFSGPGQELSIAQVLAKAGRSKNVITGRGSHVAEKGNTTCFSVQVAEVEVDAATGRVKVLRVSAVNDIGLAISPATVQAQVEGAVVQGMGYALNEELPGPIPGRPAVQTLADYKMATALDAPPVYSQLTEGASGPGPYGAKAIGEQGIAATAPAIANAIYDAVGVRITDLPITPEKIVRALRAEQEEGVGDAV